MKVIITGGAGFIGTNLAMEIVRDNEVVIMDNLHSGSYRNVEHVADKVREKEKEKNLRFVRSLSKDIKNHNIKDVDTIFHFGIPSSSPMYKDHPYFVGEAINGAIGVFEYARNESVSQVVYASSSSLYNGNPPPHREDMEIKVTDYYTEARLTIERIAKLYNDLYGIRSVGLRFFSVYGPHEEAKREFANIITQFLWEMKKGKSPVIYGDGNQRRDFIHVKDVVKACLMVSERPSEFEAEIFNVGTGVSCSFNNVVELLNKKLNTNICPNYRVMPMKNYVAHTLADMTKIKKIGFEPDYTLERGIEILR